MHHALTRETKRINTAALAERVDKEKAMVKRSQILEECQAVVEKQLQVDKLGLDDPVQQSNAEEAIQSFMEGEYGKMIQEIRKKEQRTKEAAEKKKAAEEKEKLKILQSHPSTLMKDALESIVDAKFKEVQREGIEEQMEEETDVTYELERACEALQTKGPKNRQAPAEARGRAKSPPRQLGQQAIRRVGNGTTAIHGGQPQTPEKESQEDTMAEKAEEDTAKVLGQDHEHFVPGWSVVDASLWCSSRKGRSVWSRCTNYEDCRGKRCPVANNMATW